MATITEAQIRTRCGMGPTSPATATLTIWIADNLAIITQSYPSVADAISNVIIGNRISVVYTATRNQGIANGGMQTDSSVFPALSADEKRMLGDERKTYWT